jgi:hypothetical protein
MGFSFESGIVKCSFHSGLRVFWMTAVESFFEPLYLFYFVIFKSDLMFSFFVSLTCLGDVQEQAYSTRRTA